MLKLFADTGIQTLCVGIPQHAAFDRETIGQGWQRCRVRVNNQVRDLSFVQWQVVNASPPRLLLAVDTSCGDPNLGFFCDKGNFVAPYLVSLEGLLDLRDNPLDLGDKPIVFTIGPASAGGPLDVHLVVDFGNSRTGGLLVEIHGPSAANLHMLPFQLTNRWQMDAWDAEGRFDERRTSRWFSARTHWCASPYLPPETKQIVVWQNVTVKNILGQDVVKQVQQLVHVTPEMFDDYSMVRMGPEVDDVVGAIRMQGDERTGVSSPKRHLWADDDSWLEGANWFMADPTDRYQPTFALRGASPTSSAPSEDDEHKVHGAKLQGPLLQYLFEDDNDALLKTPQLPREELASESPPKPRHAPRVLMTAALYELLSQAYAYVNGLHYREATGLPSRPRRIKTLTLTYPSGMIVQERERLEKQAKKAAIIFHRTVGKQQPHPPHVTLGIDEASAVHLTYIWSELQMMGQNPPLWFSLVGRRQAPVAPPAPPEPEPPPGAVVRRRVAPPLANQSEVRIACIDVGGGTSDLMIARYTCQGGINDSVQGEILERDGVSIAGDQLVKRLLERVIVPLLQDAIGLDKATTLLLFGPAVPGNRKLRALRVGWMNRLLAPLAQAYLAAADSGHQNEITHTNPDIVPEHVLQTLEDTLKAIRPGYYNVRESLGLVFDPKLFEQIVNDVFRELFRDFCGRIVKHNADIVLLAGQPTKLRAIQDLIRMLLPLPAARIVPMHRHYAGVWYPYQDESGLSPGVIVDPKSAVVVGAAIHFLVHHGELDQFHFHMDDGAKGRSYYWGAMTSGAPGIRKDKIMFQPGGSDVFDLLTESKRLVIGRRLSPDPRAEASPAYVLQVVSGSELGKIKVSLQLRRTRHPASGEEVLEVVPSSLKGTVGDQPARLGQNVFFKWCTLVDEHYYLDSGGLDNIEHLA